MPKILVIDDNNTLRDALQFLLEENGFQVLAAENGLKGITIARSALPDLILCDIKMPEINGYQVLETLNQNPETAIIPFIFLTGQGELDDYRHGINLGADAYLTKPLKIEEILKVINNRLKKSSTLKEKYEKKFDNLRSNISQLLPHELRTPLSGILGFSEYLIDYYDSSMSENEVKNIARTIYASGKRLNNMIENFLFYSQLQIIISNQNEINSLRQEIAVLSPQFIEEIASKKAREYNREKDLSLNLAEISTVKVKDDYLSKLIYEIIDNAFKFSLSDNVVEVNSTIKNNTYSISIINSGREMAQQQIDNIGGFTQFNRDLYEHQGAGLGLIICRLISEIFVFESKICSKNGKTEVELILKLQ